MCVCVWDLNDTTKYIFSFLEKKYCTQRNCGELSEYTDSALTEVKDPIRMFECVRCV